MSDDDVFYTTLYIYTEEAEGEVDEWFNPSNDRRTFKLC
jgi:hypothetical protein